jgi:hypothetical protein
MEGSCEHGDEHHHRHCSVFVSLINTVLLLGAPMLPTRWVKISTYFQSEPFLSVVFILTNLNMLILFVHNPDVRNT